MHTLFPAVLPLLVTSLECWNCYVVELCCRFSHNFLSWLKMLPFQRCFQFREQPEVTRCHVWRVGRVPNKWSFVFGQVSLDQVGRMSRCIVMVKLPVLRPLVGWPNLPLKLYELILCLFLLIQQSHWWLYNLLHYLANIHNEFIVSAGGWPAWNWLALNRCLSLLEAVIPLLSLCYSHSFITKGLLNLLDSLHLSITKLVAELIAVALLDALRHVAYGR